MVLLRRCNVWRGVSINDFHSVRLVKHEHHRKKHVIIGFGNRFRVQSHSRTKSHIRLKGADLIDECVACISLTRTNKLLHIILSIHHSWALLTSVNRKGAF